MRIHSPRKDRNLIIVLILSSILVIASVLIVGTSPKFISPNLEVHPDFFITSGHEIAFSASGGEGYELFTYSLSRSKKKYFHKKLNVFRPFEFDGRIVALQDNNGDDTFYPTDNELLRLTDRKPIQKIFSFTNGRLLIFQLKYDDAVYILNLDLGIKDIVLTAVENLYSVCIYEKNNILVVNYDNKLATIDLNSHNKLNELVRVSVNMNLNPYVDGSDLYFSSNDTTEFYQIYKINLNLQNVIPESVHKTDHDLRLPKSRNGTLFFIEIVNNEYLLRKIHNQQVYNVVSKGIVYDYQFYDDENLVFSYSDFKTPKTLFQYNNVQQTFQNLFSNGIIPVRTIFKFEQLIY